MRKRNVNLKLKAAIIESGKKYTEVAEAAGISGTNFSRKINGFLLFDEKEMEIISAFLNKEITDIFFLRGGYQLDNMDGSIVKEQ